MTPPMFLIILSFAAVCFCTYKSMNRPPPVPWALMVRNLVVTAIIAVGTSEDAYTLFFALAHPQLAVDGAYVGKGFAPAWLNFWLRTASTILGVVAWWKAFDLAARKPKAARLFLQVWPPLVVAKAAMYVLLVQQHGAAQSSVHAVWFYTFGPVLVIALGGMIYLHVRASSSNGLLLPVRAA